MRPTLRGWTALVIVILSMLTAWQYGPRALNAVVTPLLVIMVAGLVTVARADRPEIRRGPVAAGHVGDRREVDLTVDSSSTISATIRGSVGPGLVPVDAEGAGTATIDARGTPVVETTLESGSENGVSYEIRLEERGEHRLGPATITVSDLFGLFTRRFDYEKSTKLLVYPPVRELRAGPGNELRAFTDAIEGRDREEFDHLREYQRGDSLRDVHWKSAAKRPDADLVVTEYATDAETGSATIAADCAPDRADELATAVASVATHLLEADVDVGMQLPDGDYGPGSGSDHRHDLLAALAVLEGGDLEDRQREQADVVIRADEDGTRVVLDGRSIPFGRLVGDRGGQKSSERETREQPNRERSDSTGGSEPGMVP